ncbi:MAG: hypothetical protein K2L14_10025 [Duncaniella sp.]|nr:hypothetical protein [Duncaniella sp.]
MINRVLIRIKVVQMLYSYLLSRSEFKIIPAPDAAATRDRKYAYKLYLDLLLLILQMSGYEINGSEPLRGITLDKHLNRNLLAKSLNSLDELRALILEGRKDLKAYSALIPDLYESIKHLPAYRSHIRKKKVELKDDVELWISILSGLIAKDERFITAARTDADFTIRGFESGIEMAVETLRGYNDNRQLFIQARNSLEKSLDKAHELYFQLLALIIEITKAEEQRLDEGRNKFLPTDADLHPNTKLADNRLAKVLEASPRLEEYVKDGRTYWSDEPIFIMSLLNKIRSSEIYEQYMDSYRDDLEEDCEFWRNVFRNIILPGDDLAEMLESKSVYWNDDLHVIGTFVLKTIRRLSHADGGEPSDSDFLPQFKDDEDRNFGPELFVTAIDNFDDYKELINRFVNTRQWDTERLAFMDIVIMVTALAEILNYPAIPVPVSLNEYIEIANHYSTPRSGQFINGILFSVLHYLKEQGKLLKEIEK